MRSLLNILLALTFVCLSTTALADKISVDEVTLKLNIQPTKNINQQGHFVQKKFFTVLNKPFVSSGNFQVSENLLLWQTIKPVTSLIEYREQSLVIKDAAGNSRVPPQAETIAKLMRYLISGDFQGLTNTFHFYDDESKDCVQLKPVNASMSQFIEKIRLCGNVQVKQFVLFDKSNNSTEISLSYNSLDSDD